MQHVMLLSDERFQCPELAPMRAQLESDVLKHLADADRDPETDRLFLPAGAADDARAYANASLFLMDFRACKSSDLNAAYFNHAAAQLVDVVNRAVALSTNDDQKKCLLTGRDIIALDCAVDPSDNAAHRDGINPFQPEIRLADDGRHVEIIDTTRSGSSLYLPANGFKTSVAQAADLLADAAIGTTRTPALGGKAGGRPSTPISAAWIASLAHLAPRLLEQRVRIAPFAEGALVATLVPLK